MVRVRANNTQLVRGYVIYGQWGAGCIGIDQAKDENNINVGVAYTLWHRHDEDPAIVEHELEALERCYSHFKAWEGNILGFEYRNYRR